MKLSITATKDNACIYFVGRASWFCATRKIRLRYVDEWMRWQALAACRRGATLLVSLRVGIFVVTTLTQSQYSESSYVINTGLIAIPSV